MAFSYEDMLVANYRRLDEEHQIAVADLEKARINEDAYEVARASDRILFLDQQRNALETRASTFVDEQNRKQRQQDNNRYGLSPSERQIAHGIASGDRTMNNDQREALYAQQKQKLQHMRATGQYRDDQGRVTR